MASSRYPNPDRLARPLVQGLHPYVPGEQPKTRGLIKLNTNENPFTPAPGVLKALKEAVDGRLRLYPNPTASRLRSELARFHGVQEAQVIVGNGSDELLALAVRTFVEPALEGNGSPSSAGQPSQVVQYFHPSYSLYPVLAATHGARPHAVPLMEDFDIPHGKDLSRAGWLQKAALSLVTTPNAPSGRGYPTDRLRELVAKQKGVVVLDEAYAEFAEEHAMDLASEMPHVLVSRTFSKAYSLCYLRVGYMIGHPSLIAAMDRMRDSYNVNGMAQVAAEATLKARGHYEKVFKKVRAIRQTTADQLTALGFSVLPSQTNFLFARPPGGHAEAWLLELRKRKILVRWFDAPGIRDRIRITIGSASEMSRFIQVVSLLEPRLHRGAVRKGT